MQSRLLALGVLPSSIPLEQAGKGRGREPVPTTVEGAFFPSIRKPIAVKGAQQIKARADSPIKSGTLFAFILASCDSRCISMVLASPRDLEAFGEYRLRIRI